MPEECMPEELAETALIRKRLLSGDRQALAGLIDQHRQRLWRIVYFRLDSRMAGRVDPDDVLQDAFLDASLRLPHYSEQRQFSPFVWLRMIVGQTLIDVHRRHLVAQQRDASREAAPRFHGFLNTTSVSLTACLPGQFTSPSQTVMQSERTDKLREAIESLEPIDQEVLALRHFEELTNKEIAEVLGIEQKAASIRYVRAVAHLKEILTDTPALYDALVPANTRNNSRQVPR
jgi:RNA polymerase sigma-70 factor (ECF subfamily)